MSDTFTPPAIAVDPAYFPLTKRFRFGWIVETVFVVAAAIAHDLLRNSVMGSAKDALRNAKHLTTFERWLGIYHEQAVQEFFIKDVGTVAIGAWNFFFETAHFLVPVFVAVYLYRKFPGRYVRMRNTFLVMLFVTAPIVWGLFPITPPKFMPERYGFVDTEAVYWNIVPQDPIEYGPDGEPTAETIALEGNLYGGIPSHHLSWALWCSLALWPVVRRRWLRFLLPLYPFLTFCSVTVTGNHRFVDLAGSLIEVAIAYLAAVGIERGLARRRERQLSSGTGSDTPSDDSFDAPDDKELVT
ncbi:MAG: phosphatase PAP2 family protein [Acidimicrobiia bacterium]